MVLGLHDGPFVGMVDGLTEDAFDALVTEDGFKECIRVMLQNTRVVIYWRGYRLIEDPFDVLVAEDGL